MGRVKLASAILDRILGNLGLARASKLVGANKAISGLTNQLADKSHRLNRAKALSILGVGSTAGASAYNTKLLKDLHLKDISDLKGLHSKDISDLRGLHSKDISNLRSELNTKYISDLQGKAEQFSDSYNKLNTQLQGTKAMYNAAKRQSEDRLSHLAQIKNHMDSFNKDAFGFSDDTTLKNINTIISGAFPK